MKKVLLILILILSFRSLKAQDTIIKTDGTEIKVKVTEITLDFIKYKNFNQPDGPIRNIAINDVYMIKYQDGTIEEYKKVINTNNANAKNTSEITKTKEKPSINNNDTLTNIKIIEMVKSSISTPIILYNIQTKANSFNLSEERLMDLCDYGVPIEVLLEMKNTTRNIGRPEDWVPKYPKTTITDAKIVKWTKLQIPMSLIIEKIDNSILDFNISADSLIFLVENHVAPEVIDKINKLPVQSQTIDTLTNSKIIKLIKCGFYKNLINSKIQIGINQFDLSSDGLISLGKNGVGIAIVNEMLKYNTTNIKNDTLTNSKIIQLSEIGYPASLIISQIQTCINNFDLSSAQIKNLRDKNVYPEVIDEMKRINFNNTLKQNGGADIANSKVSETNEKSKAIVVNEKVIGNRDTLTVKRSNSNINKDSLPIIRENKDTKVLNDFNQQKTKQIDSLKTNINEVRTENIPKIIAKNGELTNEDIIQLTKTGNQPWFIIKKIQNTDCLFDLSDVALKNLLSNNVSLTVIDEMKHKIRPVASQDEITNKKAPSEKLNNESIIQLTQIGLEPSVIINKIQNSINDFDISTSGLMELKFKGVAKEVINEMVKVTFGK